MKRLLLILLFIILLTFGCNGNKTALKKEIEKDFNIAMNAYQEIWQSKDINTARKLANKAFTDKKMVEQVLEGYKANLEIDQGIKITEKSYDIKIISYDRNDATLRVRANLKGYPISISSGYNKINQKQNFSFGPHDFKMKKEQGIWKISSF
ncbi:MAG: hypothetical protein PWQ67_2415 [Clostridia bacterium]|jgi:hypothetical protein|nr:hypothetical protein [Clostridia bacterium]MDN5323961.1 hypothetical protein [Clostridia bacterium]